MKRAAAPVSNSMFFHFAEARVHHQRQVEGLLRFRFEEFDLLGLAFFVQLELVAGEVGRRPVVLVENASDDVDEADVNANLPSLIRRAGWCLRPRRSSVTGQASARQKAKQPRFAGPQTRR